MSPIGWLVTAMHCAICNRKWTHRHPPMAQSVACPDCGHVCLLDTGLLEG